MLKVSLLFIASSLLFMTSVTLKAENKLDSDPDCELEEICFDENGELNSQVVGSTFAQGYEDGVREGRRLALIPDPQLYDDYWRSYESYSRRFPNHPQNFDYFRGKYLGIVDGWLAHYSGTGSTPGSGSGSGPNPTPGPVIPVPHQQ